MRIRIRNKARYDNKCYLEKIDLQVIHISLNKFDFFYCNSILLVVKKSDFVYIISFLYKNIKNLLC